MTQCIDAIGRLGTPGRELAVRLDLLRSMGLRYARQRVRADAAAAELEDPRTEIYREIWEEAASELDAEVVPLGDGFLEIRRRGQRTRVWHHLVPLDDAVTLRLALHRRLVHALLSAEGIPVPPHVEVEGDDLEAASAFLACAPGACVVKPAADTSGGSGTTTGVRTREQLLRARLRALRHGPRMLIEHQVDGTVYRLLLFDGELLDAVRRSPSRVVGDGRSTIGELIAAESRRRLETGGREGPQLRIDLECLITLENAGLTLSSVPSVGAVVPVKTVTNQNGARDNETVVEPLSDALVTEAVQAVRTLGVRLAGVDLITSDPTQSLSAAGGVVIEVNATPGLHYHYQVADPDRATRVAVRILETLLASPR